jgi:cation diffusion facilitator family transporter
MSGSSDLRGLVLAVAVYVVIFALKLAAYFFTGVMALLAEALHTLSDIFVSGFLLIALLWSQRKADAVHMFGYGRAQNVAALVAATLFISFTSYKLYEEAIPRLLQPQESSYENIWLALTVIGISMLAAAAPMLWLSLQPKRGASAKAQLMELINDQLGLLAALAGTLFIVWGYPIGDPIATVVVATIIAVNAIALFRENASFLLGRAPGPEFLRRIEQAARSVEGVIGVRELRAEYAGPDIIHAGLHLLVPHQMSVAEAHRVAQEVRTRIHKETAGHYCVIQVEPAPTAS